MISTKNDCYLQQDEIEVKQKEKQRKLKIEIEKKMSDIKVLNEKLMERELIISNLERKINELSKF